MNVPLWIFISCVMLAGLVGWWARARSADVQYMKVEEAEAQQAFKDMEKAYWEQYDIVPWSHPDKGEAIRKIECKG